MPRRHALRSIPAATGPLAAALILLCAGAIAPTIAGARQTPSAAPPPQAAPPAAKPAPAAPGSEKTAAEVFKNIQVLKNIPASQLFPTMSFIAASLGVGCDHCHVTAEHGPWPFDKDDKKEKKTAREMMKMMLAIDDQHFEGRPEVTCATCHNGHPDPASISPVRPWGVKESAGMEEAEMQSLPPADQVLDNYVTALGGSAALEKFNTRVIKGSLTTESGRTLAIEIQQKAPDLALFTATSPDGRVSRDGFDGETAWNAAGDRVFPARGLEAGRIARDAQFFVDTDVKKHYPRRFVAGKESIGGEDAYIVRLVGHGDVSEILDFSVSSGLLLRRTALTKTALGRFAEQTDYSDYRDVDGVTLPFTVVRLEGNERYTAKYLDIKQNVPLDDSIFLMPAAPK